MFRKLLLFLGYSLSIFSNENAQKYEWAVVGAGLGGITIIAGLIDYGVEPANIIWIDPEFGMGRMGKNYQNVPSNTQVKNMRRYFDAFKVFKQIKSKSLEVLCKADSEDYLVLRYAVEPLLEITDYLREHVASLQEMVQSIDKIDDEWVLKTNTQPIVAHKVILAIGAYPKKLDYELQEIPLDDALDKGKLSSMVTKEDTIAIFGGMHSAMLVLKYLSEIGVKKIINFFTHPYFRRIPGAESLEGITKKWVNQVLEQNCPENLLRIRNTSENLEKCLGECNKVIYAIGFVRNPLPINGSNEYIYDQKTGVIEKNLYGFGIAFPHTMTLIDGQKVAINGFNINAGKAHEFIPRWIND